MRIAIGGDHRGLELKQSIIELINATEHDCEDLGSYTTESVDYPDIAREVAEAVARGDYERGILICDTGIGMSIAANKFRGIRAALCHDGFSASRARQHNDANILCLGTGGTPDNGSRNRQRLPHQPVRGRPAPATAGQDKGYRSQPARPALTFI